jgi:hypothetical protein
VAGSVYSEEEILADIMRLRDIKHPKVLSRAQLALRFSFGCIASFQSLVNLGTPITYVFRSEN